MEYASIFDIIGPIMVGPSSSHTAGAARIGAVARQILGRQPERVLITLYGSFASTYRGHATDRAVVGGLLGMDACDESIVQSLELAKSRQMDVTFQVSSEEMSHPNTIRLLLDNGDQHLNLVGVSVGGGAIEIVNIDGFDTRWAAIPNSMLVFHRDIFGVVADVTRELANQRVNIASLMMSRRNKGQQALMILTLDQPLPASALEAIAALTTVTRIIAL